MHHLDSDRIHTLGAGQDLPPGTIGLPVAAGDLAAATIEPGVRAALTAAGFDAALGEALVVASADPPSLGSTVAFGVGPGASTYSLRLGAMALGARIGGEAGVAIDLSSYPEADQASFGAALVEGLILGSYRWSAPGVTEPAGPEISLRVTDAARRESVQRFRRAAIGARATNWARRLTDTPPSDLTPEHLASLAAAAAQSQGWHAANLAGEELTDAGLTGIYAVGRGSDRPAQLIDLTYRGREAEEIDLVLAGKGITMDCGGLNLKIERAMAAVMKSDVAGGAAAIATLAAVTALELPLNVRVLIPAAENLPGPGAVLPGDVIEHFGGRTTEVALTDAEGRLVLADCLAYARATSPGAVLVDVGTISEAPFAPAGWTVASADKSLAAAILRAAEASGEVGVHFPLVEGYERRIASTVADSRNWDYGHTSQDLMLVPTFLAPFAGDSRWAHIDVCAVAYLYDGAWLTWPQGATGSPTRTLIKLLSDWH